MGVQKPTNAKEFMSLCGYSAPFVKSNPRWSSPNPGDLICAPCRKKFPCICMFSVGVVNAKP